eukprot:COSAG02_NODE_9059_length_2345_cov_205.573019_1_plen_545_part_10
MRLPPGVTVGRGVKRRRAAEKPSIWVEKQQGAVGQEKESAKVITEQYTNSDGEQSMEVEDEKTQQPGDGVQVGPARRPSPRKQARPVVAPAERATPLSDRLQPDYVHRFQRFCNGDWSVVDVVAAFQQGTLGELIKDERQFEAVDQFIRSNPPVWQPADDASTDRVPSSVGTDPLGDMDEDAEGDAGDSESDDGDWEFFDTADPPAYDGDWLSKVGADAVGEVDDYEDKRHRSGSDQAFLHGMADLPTREEWQRLAQAPEPDAYENPPDCRVSPPFVAGALHGADPSCGANTPAACADRWREMVPDMPEMVARWIAHPEGFQVDVPDRTPVDEPARPVQGVARQQLDESLQKLLRTRAVRVWAKSEGEPIFVTPIDCVPKKTPGEFRVIHDWRTPNRERGLADRKCRFEGLRHLPAVASKGGRAASLDMKSGYHAIFCGPADLMCFYARVRPSWLSSSDRVAAGLSEAPLPGESDDFMDLTLTWKALSMGNKLSAWVYTKTMRCLARRWRSQGIDCLWYLDDCIFFSETDEEMKAILHGGEYKGT